MSDELIQVWMVTEYGQVISGKCQRITEKSIYGFVTDEELAKPYGERPNGRRRSRQPSSRWRGASHGARYFLRHHEALGRREFVLGQLLDACRARAEKERRKEEAIVKALAGDDVDIWRVAVGLWG